MTEELKEQVVQDKPEEKKEDLVTRVSQVKPGEEKFNVTDIEKIQDPNAKAYAEKAYKSFEKGFQEKYRALADERKAWEAKRAEGGTWTKEKVQTLLDDPTFVNAAQSITPQSDDGSILSDTEKKQIQDAKTIANRALQQNAQLLKLQQDESNKTKYANYDSGAVDIITSDMINGKLHATREHLWKVIDYEPAVKRAYQLGLEDKKLVNTEKVNSMSVEGNVVQASEGVLEKKEKESDKNWFLRNALNRHNQAKTGK